jgi:aminoglycoside 3'-phosphotransferase-1
MQLPPMLQQALHGYTPAKVAAGESGADVYRLSKPAARPSSTSPPTAASPGKSKMKSPASNGSITVCPPRPARLSVPRVPIAPTRRRTATVRTIADFLRRLHALPIDSCPFLADHPNRLRQARHNLEAGLVDAADFDDQRQGHTPAQVWAELTALVPAHVSRVVTHGDFSLDNIFLRRGRVTRLIDTSRLGIADPYQDHAILGNTLAEFGPALQREFLLTYGLPRLHRRKLDFHLCLDESF